MTGNVKKSARKLARKKIALTGSVNADGAPGIKAMAVEKREGMKTFWFASNVGSQRAAQYMANPRACLYFFDRIPYRGLMLEGAMEVLTDEASRRLLWRKEHEVRIPQWQGRRSRLLCAAFHSHTRPLLFHVGNRIVQCR